MRAEGGILVHGYTLKIIALSSFGSWITGLGASQGPSEVCIRQQGFHYGKGILPKNLGSWVELVPGVGLPVV